METEPIDQKKIRRRTNQLQHVLCCAKSLRLCLLHLLHQQVGSLSLYLYHLESPSYRIGDLIYILRDTNGTLAVLGLKNYCQFFRM